MPSVPRDYDPTGRYGAPRLAPPAAIDPFRPYSVVERPVFGRRITPPVRAQMEPICPHECRMIEFGGCGKKCRLMAQADKEEPTWPTP